MVSNEYREAIVEVLEVLEHTDTSIVEKIPRKILEKWEKEKSTTYKPKLDYSKRLEQMNLKPKTKAILTMIYREFVLDFEERKQLDKKLIENEEKRQDILRKKYNPEEIFKEKNGKRS